MSIHEIRSRELMPQYDHQNFVCPSHPQVKGGLDLWFILLWQVQRGHVQSHLYIDLQLWFRSVSSKDIMPSGETGIQHQLYQCFKATLNSGATQNMVRQHFSNISEPYTAYRVPLDESFKI